MMSWHRRACALVTTVVCVGALGACDTNGDNEAVGSSADALSAIDNGAGAGPARFDVDPCENPRAFAKDHGYHLIVAGPNDHDIDGTNGKDLIVGTNGDDRIRGHGGDDIICAGGGEDTVHGDAGDDYIDGGSDNDKLFGDDGNDVIHGRGGGDYIYGGTGDDLLFGDILDDHLFGEAGDDLLIGGHGTDVLDGGAGNDYLRGDTGNDEFIGGPGHDIASFATAMPPGQPDVEGRPKSPFDGMKIDFTNRCTGAPDGKNHDGCANGDGGNEPLDDIEVVVGSPYTDDFVSGGKDIRFIGGYGDDKCDGQPCGTALPAGVGTGTVFVSLDVTKARDVGLIVRGTIGTDDIEIVMQGDVFRVRSTDGGPLVAGPGCTAEGAFTVACTSKHVLRYVAAWMSDGNDVVKLAEAATGSRRFPIDMTAHVNGGNGDDHLHGGDEEDVLFSGPTGFDHLYGNKGDDALLSESRKWPAKAGCSPAQVKTDARCTEDKPDAAHYTDGADELFGGPGDDQLVTDYPCGKHHYSGGGGKDVAGFARSGRFDLNAQLAGPASKKTAFAGRAYNPDLCGVNQGTTFVDDLEILEAADGNDLLWGNDDANIIWGREGDDHIHGLGGNDTLHGLVGDDWIYGGAGNDDIQGGSGNNHIFEDAE
jgi:Ca2+-binding RTX toxin-like protein